jgi:hypothetical protein
MLLFPDDRSSQELAPWQWWRDKYGLSSLGIDKVLRS